MSLLPDAGPAIRRFWAWWPEGRKAILDRFDHGGPTTFVEPLSALVRAIDAKLDWEFGPGRHRAHHLCLSALGDPRRRVVVERWRAAAPDDPDFEFYASRQRAPELGLHISFGDVDIRLADFQLLVEPDDPRQRFNLSVFHPRFEGAESDEEALRYLWVSIDHALGKMPSRPGSAPSNRSQRHHPPTRRCL